MQMMRPLAGSGVMPDDPEEITRHLVGLVVDTTFADLAEDAVGATERVLLDTIGVAAAGLTTEGGRRLADLKIKAGGTPESTLIGHGVQLPAAAASYVHSHAANLLDADETLHHRTHFGCCVMMPAVAVAESLDASGEDLLLAAAIGYDVAARICLSLPLYDLSTPGEVKLGTVGYSPAALGTAAAIAKLLGLDREQTAHALGLAYFSAPVRRRHSSKGRRLNRGMVKSTFYSAVADAGVNAALLAGQGFTTGPGMLDAHTEFWRAFGADSCDLNTVLGDLGTRWYITEAAIKPYPSCRQSGIAIDLFKAIVDREGWKADEIDEIVLRIPPAQIVRELAQESAPLDPIMSQFSTPYALAMIAYRVPPGASWHAREQFDSPQWRSFASKIRLEIKPQWYDVMTDEVEKTGTYFHIPTEVEVTAHGRTTSLYADQPLGDPWSDGTSFDRNDIAVKFRSFASALIDDDGIEEAIERAWGLREGERVRALMRALR